MNFQLEGNDSFDVVANFPKFLLENYNSGGVLSPYVTVGMTRHTGHFLCFENSGPMFHPF